MHTLRAYLRGTFGLLLLVSLPYFKSEWAKVLVALIGMVLGIAVYCAVRIANESALNSFEHSASLLNSGADIIVSGSGALIPESLYPKLSSIPGIGSVTAISTGYLQAVYDNKAPSLVQLVGLDILSVGHPLSLSSEADSSKQNSTVFKILSAPHNVLVSKALEGKLASEKIKFILNSEEIELNVVGSTSNDAAFPLGTNDLIVTDIGNFQEIFKEFGFINRFNITFDHSRPRADVAESIKKLLPENVFVQSLDSQAKQLSSITAAFRLNLHFLGAISLFIAVLLLYNMSSYSVLRRTRENGILKCLGLSSRQLFVLLATENIALGLLASILGIALGFLLSYGAVTLMSSTINALYVPIQSQGPALSSSVIFECLLLGPVVSFFGGLMPCWEASSISPREQLSNVPIEIRFLRRVPLLAGLGALCLVGCYLIASPSILAHNLLFGFLPALLLLLGVILLTPGFCMLALQMLQKWPIRHLEFETLLAVDHMKSTLKRTSIALSAMAVSVGIVIGVSTMISSFRDTVETWINHVTKADIYISTSFSLASPSAGTIPDELVSIVTAHPNVANYDFVIATKATLNNISTQVNCSRFSILPEVDKLLFKEPVSTSQLQRIVSGKTNVFVSEVLANKRNLHIGDSLVLLGKTGKVQVQIANIYYDYASDQGLVLAPEEVCRILDTDKHLQGISLYLNDKSKAMELQTDLISALPRYHFAIRDNIKLRNDVLQVFDATFRITYALQFIALLVSGLTVFNTVLMLGLERKREFGVLRAIGATADTLVQLVVTESVLLGALSLILGAILGIVLSVLLVFVINKFFFGWSVNFHLAPSIFISTGVGVVFLAYLAGLFPAKRFSEETDAAVLRYE